MSADRTEHEISWTVQRYEKQFRPTLRNSHNVVSDIENRRLFLFGGRSKGGCNNHLYILNIEDIRSGWQFVEHTQNEPPPPRKSAGMAFLSNTLYIFGGSTSHGLDNDMWRFNIEYNAWSIVHPTGDLPPPRDRHSMCTVGGYIYVFGGHGEDAEFLDDLYKYDANASEWERIDSHIRPPQRYEHTSIGMDDLLVVAGGKHQHGGLSDIWVFDTSSQQWMQPQVTGSHQHEPRWGQTVCVYNRRLIFFGGWNGRNCFNDAQILDGRTWTYEDTTTYGAVPSERTFHGAGILGDNMVVVAGRGRERRLNDTHTLDLTNLSNNERPDRNGEQTETNKQNEPYEIDPQSTRQDSVLHQQSKKRKIRITDFELRATLGTGSFGRVRLAMYLPSGEFFAIKILRKTRVMQMKQESHIKWEKKILTNIRHPFIVNLEASFQDQIFLNLVLELVQGGEFFSLLRKTGTLQLPHAAFYASQIVLVFQFLHKNQIVYRDLKPENLLIGCDGFLKLTDFGFAKRLDKYPYRTWTLCGTPEYIAPEILLNKGHSFSVDWWALGILLFEMFTGNPPFVDDNPMRIYQKILDGRIEYPRGLPDRARDFITRLLTANLSHRLGNLANGAIDVMKHPFFHGVNWRQVLEKKVRAPYIPQLRAPDDTTHFDNYDEDTDTEDEPLVLDPFITDF